MNLSSTTRRHLSEKLPDLSRMSNLAGRLLLSLICALLIAMPWTEYFWRFDRFLRGGQDFELGLLALITFFCLVLVLAQRFRQEINTLLAQRQFISFLSGGSRLMRFPLCIALEFFPPDPAERSFLRVPLQI